MLRTGRMVGLVRSCLTVGSSSISTKCTRCMTHVASSSRTTLPAHRSSIKTRRKSVYAPVALDPAEDFQQGRAVYAPLVINRGERVKRGQGVYAPDALEPAADLQRGKDGKPRSRPTSSDQFEKQEYVHSDRQGPSTRAGTRKSYASFSQGFKKNQYDRYRENNHRDQRRADDRPRSHTSANLSRSGPMTGSRKVSSYDNAADPMRTRGRKAISEANTQSSYDSSAGVDAESASNDETPLKDPPLSSGQAQTLRSRMGASTASPSLSKRALRRGSLDVSEKNTTEGATMLNPFDESAFNPLAVTEESGVAAKSPFQNSDVVSSFTRPSIETLRSLEQSGQFEIFQSEFVWDRNKDYTLMAAGPEKRSYLDVELSKGQREFVTIVLDGDNILFRPSFLHQGYEGAKFVLTEMRNIIAKKHRLVAEGLELRYRIFANLKSLAVALSGSRVVTKDLLSSFFQGIMDASHHNFVVDVGKRAQAADERVKATLVDAIQDPRCLKVYLGGLDDFGYVDELRTLSERKLLDEKVHLISLPGYAATSKSYSEYAHRTVDFDYLFTNNEDARQSSAAQYNKAAEAITSGEGSGKQQHKGPCAFHHLTATGCLNPKSCAFSHAPMSSTEVKRFRAKMKSRKCPVMLRDETCQFGEDCLFSHDMPFSPRS